MKRMLLICVGLILISFSVLAWSVGDTITQTQINSIDANLSSGKPTLLDNMKFVKIDVNNYVKAVLSADNNRIIFNAKTTTLDRNGLKYLVTEKPLSVYITVFALNQCIKVLGDVNCLGKELPYIIANNFNTQLLQEKQRVLKFKSLASLFDLKTIITKIMDAFRGTLNNSSVSINEIAGGNVVK